MAIKVATITGDARGFGLSRSGLTHPKELKSHPRNKIASIDVAKYHAWAQIEFRVVCGCVAYL